MAGAGNHSDRGQTVLRLSPGPSPSIRWGERVPLEPVQGGVMLDMRVLKFAAPTLALRLAASKSVHAAAGQPFGIIPPVDRRVRRYLARAGLAPLIGLEQSQESADVLIPVTRIRPGGVEGAAERLQSAARSLSGMFAKATEALVLALSELGGNACSHGHNPHGTFVLAQRLGRSRLVLAVGDLGVGIPAHLGRAESASGPPEEARLIAKALEPGVTGVRNARSGEQHGIGLPRLLETIGELDMPAAELSIWSSVGRVSVQMRSRPATPRVVNVRSATLGTWTEVVLASSSQGKTQ